MTLAAVSKGLLPSLVLLLTLGMLSACSNDADPVTVAQVFINARDLHQIDRELDLFSDDATVGAANLQKFTGKSNIRTWLTTTQTAYYYEISVQPSAQNDGATWVDNLYSNAGVWVGEIEMKTSVAHSHITRLDANLRRGATGVICPLCPPMCPGSDTPNIPCH